MLSSFIHVQYCYEYLVNQISMGLLLYSHLPVALMALIFSTYVLIKARDFPAFLLFNICLIFTVWCAFDLNAWFSFLGSSNTMFVWSLLDFLAVLMFFFAYYFLYVFVTGKDVPAWQKMVGIIAMIPTATIAFLGINIPTYDLNSCAALENNSFTIYTYYSEAFFILAVIAFLFVQYRRTKEKEQKSRTLFAGIGVLIFLLFFFSASFLVSLLAQSDASLYVYNYLIYGLFGMPIFLIYLGYLIVRYHAFNLKIFGAQALVAALAVLVASEFAFVPSLTTRILVGVTLLLTAFAGVQLIRSVRREIEQREKIEELAKGQENLIHIMNHQIKGYLGVARNIFAELLQSNDYGTMPETSKPLLSKGLEEMAAGVDYVQNILKGSSAHNGTLTYDMKPLDLKPLVEELLTAQRPVAEKAGLSFDSNVVDGDYGTVGDRTMLGEAFKNLITNAIKYNTPHGSIRVTMSSTGQKILFAVKDAGRGISAEDAPKLFKPGGVGKDSMKYNADSSGFGLSFVKPTVEKHRGRVWFASNTPEQGTTFFVELPVTQD